ncbi:MAG: efflux transporter outer membrane subunit [Duganella sp.]
MTKQSYPRLVLTALAAAILLGGCSLAPTYQTPPAPLPVQWTAPIADAATPTPTSAATLDWQQFVADETLRNLIAQALANNRDLRQTLLNVDASRAQFRIQRADRLPGIDAQLGGTRQRSPANMNASGQPQLQSTWQAGAGLAAFELDLFGRVRSLSDAAMEDFLATEGTANAARITLVAEVIQTYLTRDGALQRRQLTEQTLRSREASLQLIGARRERGVGSALDYQEALGLAEQARAQLERIEREIRQSGNALILLIGAGSAVISLPATPASAPLLVQEIGAGVPSELLAQRPDIRAAEHRLRARDADIGAARAAFFPRISLTGMFGSSSPELSGLFESGQRAWSFAPQLTLPIFNGGRNTANLELSRVRKEIAVTAYEQSIETAFREVNDALAATDTLRREELAQRGLAQSGRAAERLSEVRYKGGIDSHLRYLDAQRNAFASQIALTDVATQRQIALATLFRSLGGGWGTAAPGAENRGSTAQAK